MNTNLIAAATEPGKTFPARIYGKMAFRPVSPKKALQYFGMAALLTVVYYCYFVRGAKLDTSSPEMGLSLFQIGVLMLKFFIFTGWPFALMAFFDCTWRSSDAANVFLASYIVTSVLWYHTTGYGFGIFAASFRIMPYAFCAWLAHGLGALYCHRPKIISQAVLA